MNVSITFGALSEEEIAIREAAEAQRPALEALAALAELDAEYLRRRPRWDEDITAGRLPHGKADYDERRAAARANYEALKGKADP